MNVSQVSQSTATSTQGSMGSESLVTTAEPASSLGGPSHLITTSSPIDEREQMRVEFFRTYDVMTGVRIAATLGGFFGLMVLLVIYKSKCKSKSLSDEHLTAAAAAAVEEEDNELAATLEAAAFLSMNPRVVRGARRSLGNMSAPALVLTRGARFSSIGGYTSLEPPACFYYQRGKSLPGSALRFVQQESYCEEDELNSPPPLAIPDNEDEDTMGPCYYHQYLTVPSSHRRLSSITCSSADTSYLERKGSACEMGLPPPPPFCRKDFEKRYIGKAAMVEQPWDFYYPIDIQVIQPTPEISPCGSERTLYDDPISARTSPGLRPQGSIVESISSITARRLAPLASISSLGATLSEFPDGDTHSLGSDSVFLDDEQQLDTEDEVDGFATDSDDDKYVQQKYRRHSQLDKSDSNSTLTAQSFVPHSKHFLQVPCMGYPKVASPSVRAARRLSLPGYHFRKPQCVTVSSKVTTSGLDLNRSQSKESNLPSCSHSCERLNTVAIPVNNLSQRPPYPLPVDTSSSDSLISTSKTPLPDLPCESPAKRYPVELPLHNCTSPCLKFNQSVSRGSCDHVTQVIDPKSSPSPVSDNCSWSQETLF